MAEDAAVAAAVTPLKIEADLKVLFWTYALTGDHNGSQATVAWGQMALRAPGSCSRTS